MRWDEELPFIISEQTGFEEAYIQEVIKCCMVVGLISKELYDKEKVLTSKGIQERYQKICVDCRRVCEFSEYTLISSEEININSEEKPINSETSTQSKVKKSKVNNIPPISPSGEIERFISPSVDQVAEYIVEQNYGVDAQQWHSFYASKGWMVGRNRMKDWRAAVRHWQFKNNPTQTVKQDKTLCL